ncbi:MAG: ATP-binding protein [Brevinematales bacterium]|jgi:serine/threonine-protein kinase RsbW
MNQNNAEYHLFSGSSLLEEDTKNRLAEEYESVRKRNSKLSISFSTRDFSPPVKLGFLQQKTREVLALFIDNKIILSDLLIAFEEAAANIIEHSYSAGEEPVIDFRFLFDNSMITIIIDDFGKKGGDFRIENTGRFSSPEDIGENYLKTGGGMGLFLIRRIMDKISYEVKPGEYNRFTMLKHI